MSRFRSLLFGIVFALGLVCASIYALYSGPRLNSPLGLDRFDEKAVRAKVLLTASNLLPGEGDRLDLRLEQNTDRTNLRKLQNLVGFTAARYWAERRLPIQRWKYRVLDKSNSDTFDFSLSSAPKTLLEAEVSSTGRILGLTIPPRKGKGNKSPEVPPDEALKRAERLLRSLGVDVGELTLISTVSSNEGREQTYDFRWKQPIANLPGLNKSYSVKLQAGFLVSFHSSLDFSETRKASLWRNAIFPILVVGSWLFLAILTLFILVQKLRRDEMDFRHAKWFAVLAGTITFLETALRQNEGLWMTLGIAALTAVIASISFGMLFAVGESLLRQSFDSKLRCMDHILEGKWKVRETARRLLLSAGTGLILLGLPTIVVVLAQKAPPGGIIALPINISLDNLSFPGSLLAGALFRPMLGVAIVGVIFLGVWYPTLRLRLSLKTSCLLFISVFTVACAGVLQLQMRPPVLGIAVSAILGLVLFFTMEYLGWLAVFFQLYIPLSFSQVALLLTSRDASVLVQGWIGLSVLSLLLVVLGYVAVAGKPISELQDYQPEYLLKVRERERFARELEIAKGVQEKFLPKHVPSIPGFSIATACRPAMEVGGDYFDFLPLSGGRWLFLVGDVSGKGVKAAFYMTLVKGILHSVAQEDIEAKEILRRLNRLFGAQSEAGVFLTLCIVVLEPSTGELHLLSAGHNPPMLVSPGKVTILNPRGLIIGVMDDNLFLKSLQDTRTVLNAGESLVLYTDGVTEAMNRESCEFGTERLQALLEDYSDRTPEDLLKCTVDAIDEFQSGCPQADDITLMVIGR